MRRGLGLLAGALVAAPSVVAADASSPLTSVEVQVAVGCPPADRVEEEIRWRAPGARLVAGAAQQLRIVIVAEAGGFTATMTYQAEGEAATPRVLRATRCDDVAGAVALIAALTLDPDAVTTPRLAPPVAAPELTLPELVPPAPPPALPPPEVSAAPIAGGSARPRLELALTAGGRLAHDLAPGWMALAGVEVEVRPLPRWSIELAAAGGRATDAGGTDAGAIESTYALVLGSVRGCGQRMRAVEVRGCAGVDAGWLRAAVLDQPRATAADRLWLALGARVAIRYPARGRWFAQLAADVAVPLSRDEFVVTPGTLLHQPASVIPGVGLAVGVRR